jgi:hypothetical protein
VTETKQVLETCVKNCGKRFHLQVTSKDFIRDLVNIIGPKNDPSPALQEKVLNLIQCWADAFKNHPELNGVYQVYVELKTKGIEFPAQDLDQMAPIHTPQRSVVHAPSFSSSPPRSHPTSGHHPAARSASMHVPGGRPDFIPASSQHQQPQSNTPINLSPDQLAKLHRELSVVQGNITVFEEMLNELTPGNEHPDDYELLQELNNTCRAMQTRIMDLIDRVTNEEVTVELLRVNDSLNNTFVRYDRFVKKKDKVGGNPSLQTLEPQFPQHRSAVTSTADSLIDFGADAAAAASSNDSVTGPMSELRLRKTSNSNQRPVSGGADEFDAFAAARSSTNTTTTTSSSRRNDAYSTDDQSESSLAALAQAKAMRDVSTRTGTSGTSGPTSLPSELIDKKEDLDEMEKWLSEQEKNTAITTQMVESQDFERFLYERAVAADNLPPTTTTASSGSSANNSGNQRTSSSSGTRKAEADPFGL